MKPNQGKKPKEELVKELSRQSRERWAGCQALIIDEISMMSDDLFDKIDYVARCGRRRHRPPKRLTVKGTCTDAAGIVSSGGAGTCGTVRTSRLAACSSSCPATFCSCRPSPRAAILGSSGSFSS